LKPGNQCDVIGNRELDFLDAIKANSTGATRVGSGKYMNTRLPKYAAAQIAA
jgi:hypothetical protein